MEKLPQRTVDFPPNGKRVTVSPRDVVLCWRRYSQIIPAQYAVATADHESSFTTNEIDTEPSGFVSKGIFQLSDEEATSVRLPGVDLLQLENSVKVFTILQESRMQKIVAAAGLRMACPPADVWSYLSIAHNQGLDAALKSIASHGLGWDDYKNRNIAEAALATTQPNLSDDEIRQRKIKLEWWHSVASYGDDTITGGPFWSPTFSNIS